VNKSAQVDDGKSLHPTPWATRKSKFVRIDAARWAYDAITTSGTSTFVNR
jgi:hypothetical protein